MAATKPRADAPRLTARGAETQSTHRRRGGRPRLRAGRWPDQPRRHHGGHRTSKSQLYHYFADKDALISGHRQSEREGSSPARSPSSHRLDSSPGAPALEGAVIVRVNRRPRWRRRMPAGVTGQRAGRPVRRHPRRCSNTGFQTWTNYLVEGLAAIRERGAAARRRTPRSRHSHHGGRTGRATTRPNDAQHPPAGACPRHGVLPCRTTCLMTVSGRSRCRASRAAADHRRTRRATRSRR